MDPVAGPVGNPRLISYVDNFIMPEFKAQYHVCCILRSSATGHIHSRYMDFGESRQRIWTQQLWWKHVDTLINHLKTQMFTSWTAGQISEHTNSCTFHYALMWWFATKSKYQTWARVGWYVNVLCLGQTFRITLSPRASVQWLLILSSNLQTSWHFKEVRCCIHILWESK